ncbi:hypothetical protein WJX81_000344 [Elliptochloris bilobata]|uniref:Acid phosphatase/vanadium-dependent haloperoxidase-related protein n=1 Tax=Elliptochloris bilobata TaxID=381761 RepID=A0AAW1SC91_9CHLO
MACVGTIINQLHRWLGPAIILSAQSRPDTAYARVAEDLMAEADPKHASGFLTPSVGILGLIHNGPFVAAVIAFVIAQTLKAFTFWYSERRWDWTRLIGSGGMPSSHTGCVTALTTAIGVLRGTNNEAFAVGLVFSLVVMYDASGVRLHAGRQASVLNMIITELPPDHPVSDTRPLRDTLGHTPLQVAVGALLGLIVGYITGVTFL